MRCKLMSTGNLKEVVVNVENLEVTFGEKKIIHHVSFNVKRGEIIGFFGISGAGKTTQSSPSNHATVLCTI